MKNSNQKNNESIDILKQSIQQLFNEHVTKLLEIMDVNAQVIKPNELRNIEKIISRYSQEVGEELNAYGEKLADKCIFFLNQVKVTSNLPAENDVIVTLNAFIQPNLYSTRMDMFLQSLERQAERFGITSAVSEQRFQLPKSLAIVHSHNKCRDIQNSVCTAIKTIYLSVNFNRTTLPIHNKVYSTANHFYEKHPVIFWILSMAIPAIFAIIFT